MTARPPSKRRWEPSAPWPPARHEPRLLVQARGRPLGELAELSVTLGEQVVEGHAMLVAHAMRSPWASQEPRRSGASAPLPAERPCARQAGNRKLYMARIETGASCAAGKTLASAPMACGRRIGGRRQRLAPDGGQGFPA